MPGLIFQLSQCFPWEEYNQIPLPFTWLPVFKHLVISCLLSAGATGLYFPQKYIETVYVGQQAGTPILQVHAMLDNDSERPHFYLCWMNSFIRPSFSSWFNLDVHTGILSLNKTLEESDFALLSELDTSILMVIYGPVLVIRCQVSSTHKSKLVSWRLRSLHTNNALAPCSGFCLQDDNVIAYEQKELSHQEEHCLRLKLPLVFVFAVRLIRSKFMVCEVVPACRGVI